MASHHCYRDGNLWPPITVIEVASCGLPSLLKRWPFVVFHLCYRDGHLWPSITVIEMASCGLPSLLKRWPFVVFRHCYRDGHLWSSIIVIEMAICGLPSLLKSMIMQSMWLTLLVYCDCSSQKGCASLSDCVMPFVYSCWCV